MKKVSVLLIVFSFIFISIIFVNNTDKVISDSEVIPLNFNVTDSVMHPTEPIIYITDKDNKKLHSVNYETKEINEITFDLPPESITFANGEIYVSLLKGEHSSYWWEEDQEGAVAIIDSVNFTILEQFDIDIDPYDIVVDKDGYIYITPGSGQHALIKSYDRETKQEVSSLYMGDRTYAVVHPNIDRLYTIERDSYPRDIEVYNIAKGNIDSYYDSPYHGDYLIRPNFKISPDGKYIINGGGTVFSCNEDKAEDIKYVASLNEEFSGISFDLDNDRFFTAASNKKIQIYDINDFTQIGTYFSKGDVVELFYRNNELISLSKDDGNYFIEEIDTNTIFSCNKDMKSFSVAGIKGTIVDNEIYIKVPIEVNLIDLEATFESSPLSTVKVGEVTQISGETKNDFRKTITYTVIAEDGSIKEYTVKVENYIEEGNLIYGDINFDGEINEEDKNLVSNYVLEKVSLMNIQRIVADVNGDKKITYEDIELLSQYISKSINKFPVEETLNFTTSDIVMHPTNSIIYITDKDNKKLYAVDYITKDISFLSFDLQPESMTFANDELYVSLLKGEHRSNWDEEDQEGAIAIVDTVDFAKVEQFDINIDPYDMVVDEDGYIYITSGSGVSTLMKSYNRVTKQEISSTEIWDESNAQINSVLNRIYTVDVESSSRKITAYNILDGNFIGDGYDLLDYNDYDIGKNIKISPDGKYIFTSERTVFTCDEDKLNDMKYYKSLNKGFSDIVFDSDNNRFFTAVSDKKVFIYDMNSLEQVGTYLTKGDVENLFYKDNKLICISKDYNNYFIEEIDTTTYLSCKKEITSFSIAGVEGKIDGKEILVKVPMEVNLIDATATFESSPFTTVIVGQVEQISSETKNDFRKPVIYTTIAQDGTTKEYTVIVENFKQNGKIKYGDVNFDGEITEADKKLISEYIEEKVSMMDIQRMAADVNGDSNLTSEDIDLISQYLSNSIDKFKVEEMDNIPLSFNITNSVIHPNKSIIYITDKINNMLLSVDYKTKETSFISFDLMPESITYANDELYVSLLKGEHIEYPSGEYGEGAVGIINPESLNIIDQFDIDVDPYDIEVDVDGIIYVSSKKAKSYNRETFQEISSKGTGYNSNIEIHPTLDKMYNITEGSYKIEISAIDIAGGNFSGDYWYWQPELYKYNKNTNYKISPDGKYIFNGSGLVVSCNKDINEDMKYVASLNEEFIDIAFDLNNDKFYTGVSDKNVYIYDINNFEQIGTCFSDGEIQSLFFNNNKLISISKENSNNFIEEIDVSSNYDCKKDITSFNLAGVEGTINDNEIYIQVPIDVNLIDAIATFENSSSSKVKIGEVTQISGESKNDFRNPIIYTVVAEDGSIKEYTVKVENYIEKGSLIYGDVNFDGIISEVDEKLISDYLIDKVSFIDIQLLAGDVNGDKVITSEDAKLLSQYLNNEIIKFPIIGKFNFTITDSAMHPTKPIVYITDKDNKKLYSLNYKSKEISFISFNLPPESITFANNEIFVSLLKGEHSRTWREEFQEGTIAIVEAESFNKVDQFDIDIDPYDIVVDREGYIHVTSGSGQWTYMKSYNRVTKEEISSVSIYQETTIKLHPTINRIYTSEEKGYNISEGVYEAYNLSNSIGLNFKISPEGKHLFNDNGTVLTCNENISEDTDYVASLKNVIKDIAFDLNNDMIFTGVSDNKILVFNINDFNQIGTFLTDGNVQNLYFQNDELLALTKKDNNYMIEEINPNTYLNCKKDITSFSVAGFNGEIDKNEITVRVPIEVNLIDAVSTFESSSLSKVLVGEVIQVSGETKNDFRNPITYTVAAEDGTKKEYKVIVENFVEKGNIKYGDVNFDGEINEEDKNLITNYLGNNISFMDIQRIAADVNGDKVVSTEDIEHISQYLNGLIDKFIIEEIGYLPLSFNITDSVNHSTESIVYINDKSNKKIFVVDYKTKEISFISLYLPPEAITVDNDKLFVLNDDEEYIVTEIDLNNYEIPRNINNTYIEDDKEDAHGHIYIKDNKLFVILRDWKPKMIVFNASTFEQINYGSEINGVGDMVFSGDNKHFYYWYHNSGWAGSEVYKYEISGDTFTKVDETNFGYTDLKRDPLDTPIILLEDNGILISKKHVFNINDLTEVVGEFPEPIYVVNSSNNIAIGKNGIYNLESYEKIGTINLDDAKKMFFDKNGVFYFIKDNVLYTIPNINLLIDDSYMYDYNVDGNIDKLDLEILKESYKLKSIDNNFESNKDLNNDGVIDILDIVQFSKKIK